VISAMIRELAGAVFLSTAVASIMPAGSMKKYVRLAIGFVMIIILTRPITKNIDLPELDFEFSESLDEAELQGEGDALVLKFHRKNLEREAERIAGEGSKAYVDLYSDGNVRSIAIYAPDLSPEKLNEIKRTLGCDNILIEEKENEN